MTSPPMTKRWTRSRSSRVWRGSFPALETAHGMAYVKKIAPTMREDEIIIVNCSGRGDKDVAQAAKFIWGEDVFG